MIDPKKPHTVMTPQQWQQYLQNALAAHRQNPQDTEAMAAVTQATHALNAYDQEGAQQSSMGAIPGEIGAVANGVLDAAKNIPKGMGQMLHHVREGDITGAAKDIGSGMAATGKGALAPWELAFKELSGETVPSDTRNEMLHDAGSSLTGLEAMALPGQVSKGISALRGGKGGSAPVTTPTPSPTQDILSMDEDQFMEHMKKTATPEQLDPYGLKDMAKPTSSTRPLSDWEQTEKDYKVHTDAPHDLLSDAAKRKGPPSLTPQELNDLLNGIHNPATNGEDLLSNPKTDFPRSMGATPTNAPSTTPSANPVNPTANLTNILSIMPGKFGKLGKLFSMLPDATAVRNKALTDALKTSIFSGMKPDSTNAR